MSDESGVMFFAVVFCLLLVAVSFLIGAAAGEGWQATADREKFIIYCTVKGDAYESCDKIWKGEKP